MAAAAAAWSLLPDDLLSMLLSCLSLYDSFRFASVCRSWRSVALSDQTLRMLPFIASSLDRQILPFLGSQLPHHLQRLPHENIRSFSKEDGIAFVGSSGEWLVAVEKYVQKSRLYNPIVFNPRTKECLALPPLESFFEKVVLIPGFTLSSYVVAAIHVPHRHGLPVNIPHHFRVSFIRAGDADWTILDHTRGTILDAAFHPDGRLYLVDIKGYDPSSVVDIPRIGSPAAPCITFLDDPVCPRRRPPLSRDIKGICSHHILESSREMLLVCRHRYFHNDIGLLTPDQNKFEVFKHNGSSWTGPMDDLDGRTLLLSPKGSIALHTASMEPAQPCNNNIYFFDFYSSKWLLKVCGIKCGNTRRENPTKFQPMHRLDVPLWFLSPPLSHNLFGGLGSASSTDDVSDQM